MRNNLIKLLTYHRFQIPLLSSSLGTALIHVCTGETLGETVKSISLSGTVYIGEHPLAWFASFIYLVIQSVTKGSLRSFTQWQGKKEEGEEIPAATNKNIEKDWIALRDGPLEK